MSSFESFLFMKIEYTPELKRHFCNNGYGEAKVYDGIKLKQHKMY